MSPFPFPTRSANRLPPQTPLSAPLLRLTLGSPRTHTPFLHLSSALLSVVPNLLTTPTALTFTLTPPHPSPSAAAHAHPAHSPVAPFWLDAPLADFALSVEALASSCVVGVAGATSHSVVAAGASVGEFSVALVSPMNSRVLTSLAMSFLVARPLPSEITPPRLPELVADPNIALAFVEVHLAADDVPVAVKVNGGGSSARGTQEEDSSRNSAVDDMPLYALPARAAETAGRAIGLEAALGGVAAGKAVVLDLRSPRHGADGSAGATRRRPRTALPDQNVYADAVLSVAAENGRIAAVVAEDPDLCILLALKQNSLPVLCRVWGEGRKSGDSAEGEAHSGDGAKSGAEKLGVGKRSAGKGGDPRVASVDAAAVFAQSVGLRGLVIAADELRGEHSGERRAAIRNYALAVIADIGESSGSGDVAESPEVLEQVMGELFVDGAVRGGDGACVVSARGALFGPSDVRIVGAGCEEEEAMYGADGEESAASSVESVDGRCLHHQGKGCVRNSATGGIYRTKSVTFSDPVVTPPRRVEEDQTEVV